MTTIREALDLYGIDGVHPAADLFPMMSEEERAELAADANANGWMERVVITDDNLLLDGRNRLIASVEIDLTVGVRQLHVTDPVAWVLSANLHRRHLTAAQRAKVGLAVEALYAAEAKERQRASGGGTGRAGGGTRTVPLNSAEPFEDSRARAAKAVGVGHDSISKAKKLAAEAPDLLDEAVEGKRSLNSAVNEAKKRPKPPEPKPKPTPVMLDLYTHDGRKVPYPKPQGKPTFNPTNDHISWAAWSWNPVTGCLHGCDYCYARDLATKKSYAAAYPVGFTPLFHTERLDAPSDTKVPKEAAEDPRKRRVFVCSMADLFGAWVPQDWIDKVYASMAAAPQWEYLCLTKFPQRYKRDGVPPHLWAGASVDTQRRVALTEKAMRDVPAKVRWLSVEPMEEQLTFTDLTWCDWVVIGSRTATAQPSGAVPEFAPPFEWVVDLVAQARAAGAAVYLKPNLLGNTGPQSPGMVLPQEFPHQSTT